MTASERRMKIRQLRTMTYFIEAAHEIIRDEGINAVTIRNTAEKAGYTSATLYNYFENLNHLVFLAALNHLEEYNAALPRYLAGCKNSVERYMAVSECFSEFAYSKPDIYELLFFAQKDAKREEYMRQYYELFPRKAPKDGPAPLGKIFHVNNINSRSALMLEDCVEEGYLTRESADDFNEVALMVSKCILQDVRTGVLTKQEATEKTTKYYRQLLSRYMEPGYASSLASGVENAK